MLRFMLGFLSLNAIIPPLPFNIVDGQLIDAGPVMGNFNAIVSAVNANVPALIGNNTFVPAGSVTGSANAIALAPSPPIASYQQGQTFTFQAIATNTASVTVQTSGLAIRAVTTAWGAGLTGGEIQSGGIYTITDTGGAYMLTNGAQGTARVAFTPTVTFGNLSVGVTYASQQGFYFKVNQNLFFNFRVTLSSKGSSTGAIGLANLPFASPAVGAWDGGGFSIQVVNFTFTEKFLVAYPDPGSNVLRVLGVNTAGALDVLQDTNTANNSSFGVQGWYPVA